MPASAYHVLSRMLEEHVDPDHHPGLQIITDSGPLLLTAHQARDAVRAHDGDIGLVVRPAAEHLEARRRAERSSQGAAIALWSAFVPGRAHPYCVVPQFRPCQPRS